MPEEKRETGGPAEGLPALFPAIMTIAGTIVLEDGKPCEYAVSARVENPGQQSAMECLALAYNVDEHRTACKNLAGETPFARMTVIMKGGCIISYLLPWREGPVLIVHEIGAGLPCPVKELCQAEEGEEDREESGEDGRLQFM